jgi:putative colanic acid biosynthesis glycosyltransferase
LSHLSQLVETKSRRFSVVTVVLNDRAGLEETRHSLINQSCADYEWIVVDGLSHDGTFELLQSWRDANFAWVSEADRGLYDAMNKGLEMAHGEYVTFLNAGDVFASADVLARVAETLKREPCCDLLYGDAYEIGALGERLLKKARSIHMIRYGMFTHHQAMFYKRHFISDLRYTMNYRVAGDYEFTASLYQRGCRSHQVTFALCCFERGGFSDQHAKLGRKEILMVQKYILRIGPIRRAMNGAAFWMSWFFRSHFRSIYDSMRFKKVAISS